METMAGAHFIQIWGPLDFFSPTCKATSSLNIPALLDQGSGRMDVQSLIDSLGGDRRTNSSGRPPPPILSNVDAFTP